MVLAEKGGVAKQQQLEVLTGSLFMDSDYKLLRSISDELLYNECILPASRDADPKSPGFRMACSTN